MYKILKKTIILSFALFTITPLFAQKKLKPVGTKPAITNEKGVLFFANTTFNIGRVEDSDLPVKVIYKFKNIGKGPLTIKNVKVECNCLASEWTKNPVKHNDSGEVAILFYPQHQSGSQIKNIEVFSDGQPETVKLKLQVFVDDVNAKMSAIYISQQGNLRFTKYELKYDEIYTHSAETIKVSVYNPTSKRIDIAGFKAPKHMIATSSHKAILPQQSVSLTFVYSAIAANDYGEKIEEVIMVTNDSLFPDKKFIVRATLVEDFTKLTAEEKAKAPVFMAITPTVTIDTIQTRSSATVSFVVTNKGKSPMFIRKVYGTCGCTDITYDALTPIKKGKKAKITVTYNSKTDMGSVSKKIYVITNTPSKPQNELELKANVIFIPRTKR